MRKMAKKRKRSRKPKLLTKVINAGVLLLAFARPIQILIESGFSGQSGKRIADEASAGLMTGTFNKQWAMQFYGPMLAAIILKKAISMVRKTARI